MKVKTFICAILCTLGLFLFNCQETVEKFSDENTPIKGLKKQLQ